jgi:two-component system LytT family response regulator
MTQSRIALKNNRNTVFIAQEDVRYIKSDYGGSKVYTRDGNVFETYKNLKDLEGILSSEIFFRIHNSYVVNINYIKHLTEEVNTIAVLEDGVRIIVSRRRKQELLKRFELL